MKLISRVLRVIFHLLYHQFAWTYDAVAALVSAGMWVDWVRTSIPFLEGAGRILEIGHGPGHLLESLLQAQRSVIGVDRSSQMGRQAARRLRKAGLDPLLVRADSRRLPFPSGSFDAVVATFPAEYIAEPEAWRSFKRVLAPGGRIVVLLGAFPAGRHPLRLLSQALLRLSGARPEQLNPVEIQARRLDFFRQIGLEARYETVRVQNSAAFFVLVNVPEE